MHAPETAGRTFFVNKEHGVVFVGGVIHGDNQVPFLTNNPFVGAAIIDESSSRAMQIALDACGERPVS